MLELCQKNNAKLESVVKKQENLEAMINEQNDKINEFLSKLQDQGDAAVESKRSKDKGKKNKTEFYQVNICFNIFLLFMPYNY